MLVFKEPPKVRLFVGIIFPHGYMLDNVIRDCEWAFGKADILSQEYPFAHTSYYRDEMGTGLSRMFISHPRLIDAHTGLIRAKKIAVRLENRYAKNGKRTVNIDPGYINEARMVLSTTKDFSHRNYLGSKVFAEVTMLYQGKRWKPLPWTFPDYAAGTYDDFFNAVRMAYHKVRQ
jgi:hypothetical protein